MLRVFDVTYNVSFNTPRIHIHCRNIEGEYKNITIKDFYPYFYINSAKEIPYLPDIKNIESVACKLPFNNTNINNVYKITVDIPYNVPILREQLVEYGTIYEADIPFVRRFMSDFDISGCDVIKNFDDITHLENHNDINIDPMILSMDIEVLPPIKGVLKKDTDEIIMISLSWSVNNCRFHRVLIAKSGIDYDNYVFCDNEYNLLTMFKKVLRDINPDIIIGYNINRFDFPYILKRCEINNIQPIFGRDKTWCKILHYGELEEVNINGIVVIDYYNIIKKNAQSDDIFKKKYKLYNYTLKTVSKIMLNRDKLDVPVSKMREYWFDPEKQYQFFEYAMVDSDLVLDLCFNTLDLQRFMALSQISGGLLQDIANGGKTRLIEPLLLRKFKENKILFPNRPSKEEFTQRMSQGKYEGAYVQDPIIGIHKNLIVLDYSSLYPTSIISHNICVTSYIPNETSEETIICPNGAKFGKNNIGILPSVLLQLYNERIHVRDSMKDLSKSSKEYEYLNSLQYAIKIWLNSAYGMLGFAGSRFYIKEVAEAVTSVGRQYVTLLNEEVRKMGYEVVYSDTDSSFITLGKDIKYDEAVNIGNIIVQHINDMLPYPMQLSYETFSPIMLLLKKKRYAMIVKDGIDKEDYKIKGIETVRRDYTPLTSEVLQNIITMILHDGDDKGALNYTKTIISKIRKCKTFSNNPEIFTKLILSKKVSKDIDDYKVLQPHTKIIRDQILDNLEVSGLGDRVEFIYYAKNRKSKRSNTAIDPNKAKALNMMIDTEYYINKQIVVPVLRILSHLGYTENDLINQTTLNIWRS